MRLRGDGRGNFKVALSNVTIPGLYRATIHIKGEDRVLGPFERSETVAAMVRFGAADRARSEIAVREASEKALELTLRPRDRHGSLPQSITC